MCDALVYHWYFRVCVLCVKQLMHVSAGISHIYKQVSKGAKQLPFLFPSNRCCSGYLCGCSALLLSHIPKPTHTHRSQQGLSLCHSSKSCAPYARLLAGRNIVAPSQQGDWFKGQRGSIRDHPAWAQHCSRRVMKPLMTDFDWVKYSACIF